MQASRWVHASPGFVGFDVANPEHAGRTACFRAIEESAAYVSRGHRQIAEAVAGIDVDRLVMTGGAAKGRLWPQIVADALAVPVDIPVVKESTALGAAICAGVGAGLFADATETAQRIVAIERTFEPDADAAGRYDALYERWRDLYRRSLELAEAGLVRPLWRAAGT
jgi:autoinducer 2 (AI-2) kinase